MTKFRNVPVGGFSSKLEQAVYFELQARELAGEIKDIQTQSRVRVCCPTDCQCSSKMKIEYIADFKFTFVANGEDAYAEAKGFETGLWRAKRRLWMHYGPGALEIWAGCHKKPMLKEVIYPKHKREGTK